MYRTSERSRVPDRLGVPISYSGIRECGHVCLYGVQELQRQRWHGNPQRYRAGASSQGEQQPLHFVGVFAVALVTVTPQPFHRGLAPICLFLQ